MNEKIPASSLFPDNAFVTECFKLIADALTRDKYVKVKGLGTFKLIMVESRESIHINTGERILIKGHQKVSFTPDSSLRDIINEPFSCFETTIINEPATFDGTPLAVEEAWDSELLPNDSTLYDDDSTEWKDTVPANSDNPLTETAIPCLEAKSISPKLPAKDDLMSDQSSMVCNEMPASLVQSVEKQLTADALDRRTCELLADIDSPVSTVSTTRSFFRWEFVGKLILTAVVCTLCYVCNLFFANSSDTDNEKFNDASTWGTDTIGSSSDAVKLFHGVRVMPRTMSLTYDQLAALHPDDPHVSDSDTTQLRIIGTLDTCVLHAGETLAAISLRYYGRRCYWPYLVAHNRIVNVQFIVAGTIIEVPQLALRNSDFQ